MRLLNSLLIAVLAAAPLGATAELPPPVDHRLHVKLLPAEGRLEATDTITLPKAAHRIVFDLHAGLAPRAERGQLRLQRRIEGPLPLERYLLQLPSAQRTFTLRYGGRIRHGRLGATEGVGLHREFSAGSIDAEGVYLSGNTGWYPSLPDHPRLTFTLELELPAGWQGVSQGTPNQGDVPLRWTETHPQEEIYLIANRFSSYRRPGEHGEALVFLRGEDTALAHAYLDATERYLGLFSRLLTPYPYSKFALVENTWETGYGMPSFTLLGPRVIRLPFIIDSSYPHEILHNWWGNGVYVDYGRGNWSEGLTAYLADHLIKEQRGEGAEYRRDNLQKYTRFAAEEADFPLAQFLARNSTASQAVGYGKGMMLFHMLRLELGDERFLEGLRFFFNQHQFRPAGFQEIQSAFEEVAQRPLGALFSQWVERAGAPELRVEGVAIEAREGGYRLSGQLRQVQGGEAYRVGVPVAVSLEGGGVHEATLAMENTTARFDIQLPARPVAVQVDPRFDVFRKLDPRELPLSLDALFSHPSVILVVPANAPASLAKQYRALASAWARGNAGVEIRSDAELKSLPDGAAVWLLGWENRFAGELLKSLETTPPLQPALQARRDSMVLAGEGPGGAPLGWLASSHPEAIPALARKVPHYGKYSYLLFEGAEAKNTLKGQWRVFHSPLIIPLTGGAPSPLPPRPPLARLGEPN